jgi:hypothetical protein
VRSSRRKMGASELGLVSTWYAAVWHLDEGRCCVKGIEAPIASKRLQRHHVIPKERLRRDGHPPSVVWDPASGMLVERDVHTLHTDAVERIPYDCIPDRCKDFAKRHGYRLDPAIYP